jgi:hypothetical protein
MAPKAKRKGGSSNGKQLPECPPIFFIPSEETEILNGKLELEYHACSNVPPYRQLKNDIQEAFDRKVHSLCYTNFSDPNTSINWTEDPNHDKGWLRLSDDAEDLQKITNDAELNVLMKMWQRDKPKRMQRKAIAVLAQVAKKLASTDQESQLHGLAIFMQV